jgi:hypothetical protein
MPLPDWMPDALSAVAELAASCDVPWWIGGSAAMALHGRERGCEPADLDIGIAWQARHEPALRRWAWSRDWPAQWVHDDRGKLLVVHVAMAPRRVVDLFLRDEPWVPEIVAAIERIDGWPVQSLGECLGATAHFYEHSQHWRKWEGDLEWLRGRT